MYVLASSLVSRLANIRATHTGTLHIRFDKMLYIEKLFESARKTEVAEPMLAARVPARTHTYNFNVTWQQRRGDATVACGYINCLYKIHVFFLHFPFRRKTLLCVHFYAAGGGGVVIVRWWGARTLKFLSKCYCFRNLRRLFGLCVCEKAQQHAFVR